MAGRFHPNRRRTHCSRGGACVSIGFAYTLLVSLSIQKAIHVRIQTRTAAMVVAWRTFK